jgi:shikimate kinase
MSVAILIGAPGAGKSSIGKALAAHLQVQFADTDNVIVKESGKSISQIFADDGEARFRSIEREIVEREIATNNGVLSLGGGSILDSTIREVLRATSTPVIYLDVSLSNALPRISRSNDRPLLDQNPSSQWIELMERRRPLYLECADIVVSTDNQKPVDVIKVIIERLNLAS